MSQYAKVYSASSGFEVSVPGGRILGIHKTRQAADKQAYAVNMRHAEASRTHVARCSKRVA